MTDPSSDLAALIDRSIGAPPGPPPSLDLLVARGRRVRRRRRVAVAGLAAAAVVVVASGAAVLSSGDAVRTGRDAFVASPSPHPTTLPTTNPTTSPTTSPTTPSAGLDPAERQHRHTLAARAVTFQADGDLRLAPGAAVKRFLDNPYGATAPAWSEGVAITFHGYEFWYAMSGPGDGSLGGATQYVLGDDSEAAFTRFVAGEDPGGVTTSFVGPDVWPDVVDLQPVRMTAGGVGLVATAGYTVVEQRGQVDAGDAWAGAGDDTAAALVRADDGTSYYVLARRFDGKPAQYVVVPTSGNGADLDAFLALARTRYGSAR